MRIFVSGSQGQLARALAERANLRADTELVYGARPDFDLTRPEDARDAVIAAKPDLVVNAAAYTAVDKAEIEPMLANAVNHVGTKAMAEAARRLAVPIIHVSTDYVYAGRKPEAYVETDPTGPLGVYGQSKLLGEGAVAAVDPWHVILRTAWVYSPFGTNFVKTMLRLATQKDSLGIVSDQLGNPTSAFDLADCILAVSRRLIADRSLSGIYHAAGSGDASWFDFATEIFRQQESMGYKVPVLNPITTKDYPTPAQRPENSRLNCTKLKQAFGFEMPPWQQSLQDCLLRLRHDALLASDSSRKSSG